GGALRLALRRRDRSSARPTSVGAAPRRLSLSVRGRRCDGWREAHGFARLSLRGPRGGSGARRVRRPGRRGRRRELSAAAAAGEASRSIAGECRETGMGIKRPARAPIRPLALEVVRVVVVRLVAVDSDGLEAPERRLVEVLHEEQVSGIAGKRIPAELPRALRLRRGAEARDGGVRPLVDQLEAELPGLARIEAAQGIEDLLRE